MYVFACWVVWFDVDCSRFCARVVSEPFGFIGN